MAAGEPNSGMGLDAASDAGRPGALWRLTLAALRRLPQGMLSRGFGRLADVRLPRPLRRPVLGAFARLAGIDAAEAEHGLADYPSLNAFFVRRLKPGARVWPESPDTAGSPVDGVVGQLGRITGGRLLQAKGRWYSAPELLVDPGEDARFEGGMFLTLYLSPRHYHRIHAPLAGRVVRARHVPGALLPVNAAAVSEIPDLFVRNERLICLLDSDVGRVAVVAIGAYNVGRISAAFDPGWGGGRVTNRRRVQVDVRRYEPPVSVRRGEEIMAFHLGSTVVLLFEPGAPPLRSDLAPGAEIRLGEALTGA